MLNSNDAILEGLSLLIVDDDKELCQVIADIFREKGYVVEVAHDGKEAEDKLQERSYRVALIDIKLPDMEGTELLRRLKEMHPETDAIMITAYATLESAIKAMREGAFAYVQKPLAMDEVIATVERALEKRHLAMETTEALTREREDKEYYRLLSITDGLTEVYNRRHFEELLAREIALAKRYRYDLSLLMIDLDHFKEYNDTYGHLAGDRALRQIARTLKGMCREVDIIARYGGEEFAILMPFTRKGDSAIVGERLRGAVAQAQPQPWLTISIGVAAYPGDAQDGGKLIAGADQALYEAKRVRNRVCVFEKGDNPTLNGL